MHDPCPGDPCQVSFSIEYVKCRYCDKHWHVLAVMKSTVSRDEAYHEKIIMERYVFDLPGENVYLTLYLSSCLNIEKKKVTDFTP